MKRLLRHHMDSHNMQKAPRKRSDSRDALKACTYEPCEKVVTQKSLHLQNGGSEVIHHSQTRFLLHEKHTTTDGTIAKQISCLQQRPPYPEQAAFDAEQAFSYLLIVM